MATKWHPGHYLLMSAEYKRVADNLHRIGSSFAGFHKRPSWKYVEPSEGVYDWGSIDADLAACTANGYKLIIQFDYRFIKYMPGWIATDYPEWLITDGTDTELDLSVQAAKAYLIGVIQDMGARYDGHADVSLLAFQETASKIDGGLGTSLRTALVDVLTAASAAWPTTPIAQYTNFINDLETFVADIIQIPRVGVGGPDVVPMDSPAIAPTQGEPWLYPLIPSISGTAPINYSIQSPEYCGKTTNFAASGLTYTPEELFDYAVETLKSNFVSWVDYTPATTPPCEIDGIKLHEAALAYVDAQSGRIDYDTLPTNCGSGEGTPDPIVRSNYGTRPEIPGTAAAYAFDQRTQGGTEITGEGSTYHDDTVGNGWNAHTRVLTDVEYPDIASAVATGAIGASQDWMIRQNRIGEWQEWTIDVPVTATVIPRIEYAAPEDTASTAVRVTLDGTTIANLSLPSTGAWGTFATADGAPVTIAAGTGRVLRVECLSAGYDWTQLAFVTTTDPGGEVDPGAPGPAASTDLRLKYWSR